MKLLTKSIFPTGRIHSATIIFLHGSGDSGANLMEWIRFLIGRDMVFSHIKIIYPTAPLQPYTPLGGQHSNVWFDRKAVSIEALESRRSMSRIYEAIHEIINEEISEGIHCDRIIVGGFSMGGALALHAGYHLNPDLAGVFACSSFLNRDSIVYESLKNRKNDDKMLPELYMFHGDSDSLVPCEWGKETFEKLSTFGIKGKFTVLENTLHELKQKEILELQEWILKKLPPCTINIQNKL